MIKYTYFWIDLLTIIVPLIVSFHPKLNFYKTWKALFPAIIITGLIFLCWDVYFTHMEIWGFNYDYLTGLNILNLPVEEVFFFVCIPYACLFTFYCLNLHIKKYIDPKGESIFTLLLIIILFFMGIIFCQKIYTAVTFISFAIILAYSKYFLKITWLGEFYIIWCILLFPFFIVNGILTGTGLQNPIVWYNNEETLDIRMFTIPVEDLFYGMELIMLNLLIYLRLNKNFH